MLLICQHYTLVIGVMADFTGKKKGPDAMSGPPQQHQFRRAIISGNWYGLSHGPQGNCSTTGARPVGGRRSPLQVAGMIQPSRICIVRYKFQGCGKSGPRWRRKCSSPQPSPPIGSRPIAASTPGVVQAGQTGRRIGPRHCPHRGLRPTPSPRNWPSSPPHVRGFVHCMYINTDRWAIIALLHN